MTKILKFLANNFNTFFILSACHKATITASCSSQDSKCDLVGPPDAISNLRPTQFYIPSNEAPIEKEFRLRRQQVQQWNQEFWETHNTKFIKERKDYMAVNQSPNSDSPMTADEMSVFYKSFLDKNWRSHLNYNFEWYRKNISLVLLHLRVKIFQLQRRFRKQ